MDTGSYPGGSANGAGANSTMYRLVGLSGCANNSASSEMYHTASNVLIGTSTDIHCP